MRRIRTKFRTTAALSFALCVFAMLAQEKSWAGDDFANVVHQIEARYHVHRNYHFLMGFAGALVKCSAPFTGVKGFKAVLFENQRMLISDDSINEVVQSAQNSGWQPLVRTYSRQSGTRTYIYAQPGDNDLKMLIVVLDSDDAMVIQVKINPNKLSQFISQHEHE